MIDSTTTSMEGYRTETQVDDQTVTIDAGSEAGPRPTEALVASYASCYTVALRIGAQQREAGDLGRVEIDAEADRDTDDNLDAIRFAVAVESDLDDEILGAIVDRANALCHVHDALREGLHADVSIRGNVSC